MIRRRYDAALMPMLMPSSRRFRRFRTAWHIDRQRLSEMPPLVAMILWRVEARYALLLSRCHYAAAIIRRRYVILIDADVSDTRR